MQHAPREWTLLPLECQECGGKWGGHLSEPSKGGEHVQSCRSSAKGGRAGAVGSGEAAEGPLTHLTAAWKRGGSCHLERGSGV